jgi:hypothetical protein
MSRNKAWDESFPDAVHAGARKAVAKVGPDGELSEENTIVVKLLAVLSETTNRSLAEKGLRAVIAMVLSMGNVNPTKGGTTIELPEVCASPSL